MKTSSLPPSLPAVESTEGGICTLQAPLEPLSKEETGSARSLENKQKQSAQKLKPTAIAVFGSTFLTILLSEMGDKTQLATLLMSAESQSPWTVFAGASTALIATSLLGVLLGRWLAKRISPRILEIGAGVSMLFIAAQLLWEIVS